MSEPQLLGFALNSVLAGLPDAKVIFGKFARRDELTDIVDEELYPVSLYVETTDHVESMFGRGAMLSLGKKVGEMVVRVSLEPMNLTSVRDAIHAVQGAHEQFCHPTVGSFEVTEEDDRSLILRYTAPYNCVLQEGLFYAISKHYGGRMPVVKHLSCRRDSGDHCLYSIGK